MEGEARGVSQSGWVLEAIRVHETREEMINNITWKNEAIYATSERPPQGFDEKDLRSLSWAQGLGITVEHIRLPGKPGESAICATWGN